MSIIVFIIIGSLFLAREIAGYDSRYNSRKHFIINNKKLARLLLPKTIGGRNNTKRTKTDFNKMTYIGAVFYVCNLLIVLSIPILLILVPEFPTKPFAIDTKYIHGFVDTVNEKLPILSSLLLLSFEIIFEFLNILNKSKKQKNNWMIILSFVVLLIIVLFALLMLKEIVLMFFNL